MTTHFVADLHLGHRNIIRYCNRPFSSVEEMDEHLIREWNRCVKPTDTVYFLGDLSFAGQQKTIEYLNSLNGFKHVVFGNHDKTLRKVLREQQLVESQQDYLEIKIDNQFIVLSHYAMRVWNKSYHGSLMFYGHSHGTLPRLDKSLDVGVDSNDVTNEYRPVSLDEIRHEKCCLIGAKDD